MRNLIFACLIFMVDAQSAYAKSNKMSLLSQNTSSETIDLGQIGASVGDITVTRGLLLDPKTKEPIGSYVARKIIVSVDLPGGEDERDTLAEYKLPNGTLIINGLTTNNSKTNLPSKSAERPIVGGTGKYFGSKGTSTISPMTGQPSMFLINVRFK